MKSFFIGITLLLLFSVSCCITAIEERSTMCTFYIKNRSASLVRVVGVQVTQDDKIDTIFTQNINSNDSILVKQISVGFGEPENDPFLLDSCDTVYIMKGDTIYYKATNNPRYSQAFDSSSIFFEFYTDEFWTEFYRTYYERKKSEVKEIFFEYVVE